MTQSRRLSLRGTCVGGAGKPSTAFTAKALNSRGHAACESNGNVLAKPAPAQSDPSHKLSANSSWLHGMRPAETLHTMDKSDRAEPTASTASDVGQHRSHAYEAHAHVQALGFPRGPQHMGSRINCSISMVRWAGPSTITGKFVCRIGIGGGGLDLALPARVKQAMAQRWHPSMTMLPFNLIVLATVAG
jgi:hypothetical protein